MNCYLSVLLLIMTIIYGHRHVLDIFFTTPVSKAKYFFPVWHVSIPGRVWAQEEKGHLMVGVLLFHHIVFIKKDLHSEGFKKIFWDFNQWIHSIENPNIAGNLTTLLEFVQASWDCNRRVLGGCCLSPWDAVLWDLQSAFTFISWGGLLYNIQTG